MPRLARIVIVLVLCTAAASGLWALEEKRAGMDETRYAELPPAQAPLAISTTTSTTEKFKFPILVYHIVRPSYPSDSSAVRALAHTPEVFDEQMQYLGTAGYHVVSFSALENYFRDNTPLPAHPIIISFDDGWSDQFIYAFPILEKYHYTATFFVFTNPIGTKGFITWDELRIMQKAGMTIGSHSRSHPYLTKVIGSTALWNEISGSKQTLEQRLGIPIHEFAYPFGQYNPAILAAVEQAGYRSARGDHYYRGEQSPSRLYELDALNAPTTTALFARTFPSFSN